MSNAVVVAPVATLFTTPEETEMLTQLLQGEPVLIEEERDGWARVVATAQAAPRRDPRGYPGWMRAELLDRTPALVALENARELTGTPYVWGGLTPEGIDCSGLVHRSFRGVGITLPRDAADQFTATTPVTLGEERVGDLYFFRKPETGFVYHVGFVTGGGNMLHACGPTGRVIEEPMPEWRREHLVGAHRVV